MPQGFYIGPLFIRYYGIIVTLGAFAAAWLSSREAKRRGLDPEFVWDGLIWVLIGGIVGARLWHIFTPPESMVEQGITTYYYLTHPLDAINIRQGGLGIPGAVIGGGLALYVFTRRKQQKFAVWADIVAPALALGQAIGRWGNFINQELYGGPTDLPWGIFIEPRYRVPGYEMFERFHPLFLYESIWNLANMFFLILISKRFADRMRAGDVFLIYLVTYPVGRFLLEFMRLDAAKIGGINANQTLMVVVASLASIALIIRHRSASQENAPDK